MKSFYKVLTILTSVLFVYLFSLLFFRSDSFVLDIGLEPSLTSMVIARRVAMFMLGIAVLTFCSRNLESSNARKIICQFLCITLLGLSCMGTYEYVIGNINSSIFTAIIIETILWISYGFVAIKDHMGTGIE